MTDVSFLDSALFTWVILPILIFCARIIDVSIGTLRIIFISKGRQYVAPILGFFEVLVWILAIGQIFKHLNNIICYVAYASGFATGNFVGMYLEHKLAIGTQMIRIITRFDASELINELRSAGFGLTIVDGEGAIGPVKIIFTLIRRREQRQVVEFIQRYNPKAFFSIEDVRTAKEGVFLVRPAPSNTLWAWLNFSRKGK